jgi:hypothetical protein
MATHTDETLARRAALVATIGVTNHNADGTPMSKSRRQKRRLLASKGVTTSFGTHEKEGPTGKSMRKAARLLKRRLNATVTGASRPLCKLDAQAKDLGVYGDAFHCMTRAERKTIVSIALTKQRQAA